MTIASRRLARRCREWYAMDPATLLPETEPPATVDDTDCADDTHDDASPSQENVAISK